MKFELLLLICLISSLYQIECRSDQFGNNPHHELGSVWEDASLSLLPYWRLAGDARILDSRVRLVPDRQSKVGSIWNTIPNSFENWEVVARIQISGSSALGADGMAFWYVDSPDPGATDFFGYQEKFEGVGVIIDTYDNDLSGDHPMIVGVHNNGKKKFTHSHDHDGDDEEMEIGNCVVPLRNKPPVLLRIVYLDKILTVETQMDGEWEQCLSSRVYLPKGYYFGFSANTGDLADDHDVLGFSIKNLDSNAGSIDSQSAFAQALSLHQVNSYLAKIEKSLYETLLPSVQSKPDITTTPPVIPARTYSGSSTCDTSRLQNLMSQLSNKLSKINQNSNSGDGVVLSKSDKRSLNNLQSSLNTLKSTVSNLDRKLKDNSADTSSGSFYLILFSLIFIVAVAGGYYIRVSKTNKRYE